MIHNTIRHLPKVHRFALISAVAVLTLLILLPFDKVEASRTTPIVELIPGQQYPLEMPAFPESESIDLPEDDLLNHENYTVRRGDTLAKILAQHKQPPIVTHKVVSSGDNAKVLRKIKPGDSLYLYTQADGTLKSLRYPISKTETLVIRANQDAYESYIETKEVEKLISFAKLGPMMRLI